MTYFIAKSPKRSRQIAMTTLMCGASLSLTACDGQVGGDQAWREPAAAIDQGKPVDAFAYPSIQACFDANDISDDACREAALTAIKDHEAAAPRYAEQSNCEDVYGPGQCVPRGSQGGGGFFTPLLTGFVVGQMLNGGYRGTGLYHDRQNNGYYTSYGGRLSSDYRTGRTQVGVNGIDPPAAIKASPPKIQTRTSVLSRGGFGGRMSAYSASGGHWGG